MYKIGRYIFTIVLCLDKFGAEFPSLYFLCAKESSSINIHCLNILYKCTKMEIVSFRKILYISLTAVLKLFITRFLNFNLHWVPLYGFICTLCFSFISVLLDETILPSIPPGMIFNIFDYDDISQGYAHTQASVVPRRRNVLVIVDVLILPTCFSPMGSASQHNPFLACACTNVHKHKGICKFENVMFKRGYIFMRMVRNAQNRVPRVHEGT